MSIDLNPLNNVYRLLFKIPLEVVQGNRFQPTGFPSLGAARFQTADGDSLLVESAQSMANRLEMTIWDATNNDIRPALKGLSHVTITRAGDFLTDTILESHRLNSPYLLEGTDRRFIDQIKEDLSILETGPVNRKHLADTLLKYDVNSLLHGVFLAKKDLAGGRLRVARALSAFIEADKVHVAASGGVKNDHINPRGVTESGFGNVPFARDEYTADSITLYVNLDLSQIRGYGFDESAERLLILLSLYKLRALTDEGMRLRTACDLQVKCSDIGADVPKGWLLPDMVNLEADLRITIDKCKDKMEETIVTFEDDFKIGKNQERSSSDELSGDAVTASE